MTTDRTPIPVLVPASDLKVAAEASEHPVETIAPIDASPLWAVTPPALRDRIGCIALEIALVAAQAEVADMPAGFAAAADQRLDELLADLLVVAADAFEYLPAPPVSAMNAEAAP